MGTSNKSVVILAIESSCDDTSAAVIVDGQVRSNLISNQTVHKNYGGVVPELASRQHHQQIIPVVHQALEKADIELSEVNAVAFTEGPGLLGSLLVGCSFAKGLALALDLPLIGVNHMEAHVLAHFVEDPTPNFPFLCLTVSGGHTQLVKMEDVDEMTLIGKTRDDAAGEAFDKIGKFIGLEYPAGPIIDRLAQEGSRKFSFPKPKIDAFDFSFSGLKTAVMYFLRDELKKNPGFIEENREDICTSVQGTIVDILIDKLEKAALHTRITEIGIAGGVSANSLLRSELKHLAEANEWNPYVPHIQYCTDNAGMIAMAAHFKYLKGRFTDQTAVPNPRMKISE